MKIVLKVLLVIHGITEITVAVIMLFFPEVFINDIRDDIMQIAASFGIGALAVGVLSFLLLIFSKNETLKVGLIVLILYQLGICILQILYPMENFPVWVAPLFHGIFVIGFGWCLVSIKI